MLKVASSECCVFISPHCGKGYRTSLAFPLPEVASADGVPDGTVSFDLLAWLRSVLHELNDTCA